MVLALGIGWIIVILVALTAAVGQSFGQVQLWHLVARHSRRLGHQ